MKILILAVLFLSTAFSPFTTESSTYGKPYGSTDETEMERSDVKTIDQINRSTSIDDEEILEPESGDAAEPAENEQESAPEENSESQGNKVPLLALPEQSE